MRAVADGKLRRHVDAVGFERLRSRSAAPPGSITRPLPITARFPGRRIPDGINFENEFLLADQYCVAGVVAALIARDDVETIAKKIDDLPLAFVSPLRAENNNVAHAQTRSL